MNRRIKNLIITVIILLAIILVFALLGRPLPKKIKDKSYEEKLATTEQIDILIHAPYDSTNIFKSSKSINKKDEIENITNIFKNFTITDEIYNSAQENDHFYYTMLLKNEDNKNNLNILFKDDKVSVDGKVAKLSEEDYEQINNYVKDNIKGYGILNCKREKDNDTLVEKYYFRENNIYHYQKSQTYAANNVQEISNNLTKYNSYNGVSAVGNSLDNNLYSYIIDIDLSLVSDDNFKNITGENKNDLIKQTKDDLVKDKKNMICNYNFL